MKERIKQYIDYKGITAGELAVMLDVQRSNISHILNGRNKPGAALIEKLLLVFPDLNARWLLTGQGNMCDEVEDTAKVVQEPLPFPTGNETEVMEQTVDTTERKKIEEVLPIKSTDDIEKMILLYKDGTFTTYNNRDKK